MQYRHRYIVIYILLFTYLLLGAASYFETVTIIGFGTNPYRITKSVNSHSSAFKICYTQHKHIPSTVKVSIPSPAVFMPPEMPRICMYGIPFTQCECGIVLDQSFSLHSSRAPPQV